MGIKTRMVLTVSIVYLLFSVTAAFVAFKQFGDAYRNSVADNLTLLATTLADDIDGRLLFARNALDAVATKYPLPLLADPAQAQRFLDQRITLHAIFRDEIQLIDARGRLLAAFPPRTERRDNNLSDHEFITTTLADGQPHVFPMVATSGQQERFNVMVTAPIINARGETVALLAGRIDLFSQSFQAIQITSRLGSRGHLHLVDRNHSFYYRQLDSSDASPQEEGRQLPPGMLPLIEQAKTHGVASGEIGRCCDEQPMVAAYRSLRHNDWLVGVCFAREAAYALLAKAQRTLLLLTIGGLALLLIIVVVIAERFTAPLVAMAAHVRELPSMPAEAQLLNLRRSDEIGTLAKSFDEMVVVVDEQKEALRAAVSCAEEEQTRSAGIIEGVGEGISILDRNFRILYQNQIHQQIVGGSYLGEYCYRSYEGAETVCRDCPVAQVFANGAIHTAERTIVRNGNALTVEITASPLRNAAGEIVAGIEAVRDITERKRTELQIQQLNLELAERAAALETLNREQQTFSYSLTHDIKTPLSTIYASSQMLLDDYGSRLDETGRFLVNAITLGCERLDEIIDAMLQLNQVSNTELLHERVDLSAQARAILHGWQATEPQRQVTWQVADEMTASGDPRLLRSVLENLLGNAWKYSCKKENAHIECGRLYAPGETVYFVRDNGAGFDMTKSDRLFKPFKRLHGEAEFPGVGIGLATVAKILQRHHGRIWAESTPGQGATFYFTLG